MTHLRGNPDDGQGEGCTCPSMDAIARGEVVQSREPCPVHGEPDLSRIELLPRIGTSGPMMFVAPSARKARRS